MTKAVFLDRDGVINRDLGYVFRRSDFEFLPGAIEAMHRLVMAGYALIIVTNQSGIARGYYSEDDFQALNKWMCTELARQGVPILSVYYCPHHPDGVVSQFAKRCGCRKPAPGLFLSAEKEHDLDIASSIVIGDKMSDVLAGRAAGVTTAYLISSPDIPSSVPPDPDVLVRTDLGACVDHLLAGSPRNGRTSLVDH